MHDAAGDANAGAPCRLRDVVISAGVQHHGRPIVIKQGVRRVIGEDEPRCHELHTKRTVVR
jgi:hypothetical protein